MINHSRRALLLGCAGLALGPRDEAIAQAVLKLVVPFGTGAVMDTIARTFNTELGNAVGVPAIVESRAGAGGSVGTATVARAPADGFTLLLASTSHHIAAALHSKLPYDVRDFTGIAFIGSVGYALVVSSATGATSLAEFLEQTKRSPGQLNYASAGNGSNSHLAMASLCTAVGLDMTHIPLKSTGDALVELLAGRVHATILSTIGVVGLQKDPRVRVLATTGKQRNKYLPETPTLAEMGLPGFTFDSWVGLIARSATPKADVARLNSSMESILKDREVIARLDRVGVEARSMSVDEFNKFLADDLVTASALVKAAKLKVG